MTPVFSIVMSIGSNNLDIKQKKSPAEAGLKKT